MIDKRYKLKGGIPSVLAEPVHMLQIYDPCNLRSNPSSIKFLSTRRGIRHISKKNTQINMISLKDGERKIFVSRNR